MSAERPPEAQHVRFDRMTEGLEEYDALPSLLPDRQEQHDEDGRSEQLDDQILAGLVCPV